MAFESINESQTSHQPSRTVRFLAGMAACLAIAGFAAGAQAGGVALRAEALEPHRVEIDSAVFAGSPAVRVKHQNRDGLALIPGVAFKNGEIELDLAATIDDTSFVLRRMFARGFIGLAFRVQDGGERYESLYLRPANARVDDQLRRNHSVQYAAAPDHGWRRLRKESPGKYESYVDLQLGVWTHMRIVVRGTTARLYVGGAEEPCLVVDDLRLGETEGPIGLWVGMGTVGYFRNLRVTEAPLGG